MTDAEKIQWGPEIEVHGKRPEWLEDERIQLAVRTSPKNFTKCTGSTQRHFDLDDWKAIVAIRLPADHPHYAMMELQAVGQDADWTPDERTVRACIEAARNAFNKKFDRKSVDSTCVDGWRIALDGIATLLPDPAKALVEEYHRHIVATDSEISENDKFHTEALSILTNLARWLIETGRVK